MKKRGKRGEIQISFGMIFSIILIIAFIGVAFYAINIFLGWKKCVETGMFKEDLQEAVDKAWSRDSSSEIFSGNLQASLDRVCFVDLSKDKRGEQVEYYDKLKKEGYMDINVFFWPLNKACEGQRGFMLRHVNISYITENANPHCAESINGKIELGIEKGFDDALVYVGESRRSGEKTIISSAGCENCADLTSSQKADCCLDEQSCCL